MNSVNRIEKLISQMHLSPSARLDKRILNDAYTAIEKATQAQAAVGLYPISRITLTSPVVVLGSVAAAIAIIVSVVLVLTSKGGIDIRQLSEALIKVDNICMTTYLPDQSEPVQQQWASRSLSINMLKAGDKYLLWDLSAGIIKSKSSRSTPIVIEVMPESLMAVAEEKMAMAFALVPGGIAEKSVAENVKWNRLDRSAIESASKDTEVYDLIWTDQEMTAEMNCWRYFVDSRTNLPSKIEFYTKQPSSLNYNLSRYMLVSYPTQEELRATAISVFGLENQGQRPTSGYPEYMSTPGSNRRNGL